MSKKVKFGIGGECWFCGQPNTKNVEYVGQTTRYVCSDCHEKRQKKKGVA